MCRLAATYLWLCTAHKTCSTRNCIRYLYILSKIPLLQFCFGGQIQFLIYHCWKRRKWKGWKHRHRQAHQTQAWCLAWRKIACFSMFLCKRVFAILRPSSLVRLRSWRQETSKKQRKQSFAQAKCKLKLPMQLRKPKRDSAAANLCN